MNNFIAMAEVTQDPKIRYTSENQTPLAEMSVQIAGLRSEDPPETLKVVAWGNLAQEVQEKYHTGDCVILEGRLGMITIEREGFKEKQAELTIQRIHRIEGSKISINSSTPIAVIDSAPVATPAPTPTKAPAPTATSAKAKTSPATSRTADRTPVGAAKGKGKGKAAAQPEPDYDDINF